MGCELLSGKYDISNWLFLLIPIHLLSSFLFLEAAKELMLGRKETWML